MDSALSRKARAVRFASWLDTLRVVACAFVVSRLALLVAGLMGRIYLQPLVARINPVHPTAAPALNLWGAWDSGWLMGLAQYGYAAHPSPDGQVNWAFFPGYPVLSAVVARYGHLPIFLAMLLVSNLAFFAALCMAHRLASREFGRPSANMTIALLCAAPGSYVFSSAYTESLFLFGLTGCLLMLQDQRWIAAGAFGGLAALTRNLGVGLTLPFAIAAAPPLLAMARGLSDGRLAPRAAILPTLRIGLGLAGPVVGLGLFSLYLLHKTGDPLAFVHAQKAWGRTIGNPLMTPFDTLTALNDVGDDHLVSFAFCWLSLGLAAALAFLRRWGLLALALFMMLVPLSTGLYSYARYCLVILPLFLAGGRILADRPVAAASTLTALATVNGFMMVAWSFCLAVTA